MSSDSVIRLQAFKTIFVFRPKIDYFRRPKMTKFSSGHFSLVYVPRGLGVSKKSIGNHF